jgi:uncharacterized membrane protein YkoI
MKRILTLSVSLIALASGTAASQQAPAVSTLKVKEEAPGLIAKATVTPAQAQAAAQAKVPKGTAKSAEIEQEHGKLVYSFEFTVPGKTGVDEVNVDAKTGKVLGVEHESPEDEAKEQSKVKPSSP